MEEFIISGTGVKFDVDAIKWPANASALVRSAYDRYSLYEDALVCCILVSNKSKAGMETSEIRIKCSRSQVIGKFGSGIAGWAGEGSDAGGYNARQT